jgi:hypothetical protein
MKQATRRDIVSALGDVDESVVSDIMRIGASLNEFAEARAWIANDEPLLNSGRRLASGRVGQLVEILASVEEEDAGPTGHAA